MNTRLMQKVDALGQELAREDAPTRAAMIARLETVAQSPSAARRRDTADGSTGDEDADDIAEERFDNLPL